MKRIFIGMPLPAGLQAAVQAWVETNGEKIDPQNKIRWTPADNLHVTLLPPWESDDIEAVSEKLRTVRFQPFELAFDQVIFAPTPRDPRMIWAAGPVPQGLPILINELNINLVDVIHDREKRQLAGERKMRLHATVARFRGEDYSRFDAAALPAAVDWRMEVKKFVLYESRLFSSGAEYTRLAEFPAH